MADHLDRNGDMLLIQTCALLALLSVIWTSSVLVGAIVMSVCVRFIADHIASLLFAYGTLHMAHVDNVTSYVLHMIMIMARVDYASSYMFHVIMIAYRFFNENTCFMRHAPWHVCCHVQPHSHCSAPSLYAHSPCPSSHRQDSP